MASNLIVSGFNGLSSHCQFGQNKIKVFLFNTIKIPFIVGIVEFHTGMWIHTLEYNISPSPNYLMTMVRTKSVFC